MSPVSPVYHTEATVSIGLKNVLRVGISILLDVLSEKQSAQNFPFNSPLVKEVINKRIEPVGCGW